MMLLRLYCPLQETPAQCDWALLGGNKPVQTGRSRLKDLPKRSARIQLVVPAPETMIARTRLPAAARRTAGSMLAFAIEDQLLADPDASQVSWLGTIAEGDALAVLDRNGLDRWRKALGEAGIRGFEVHSEMLLLPQLAGQWSMAWNGREGFVRTGKFEAAATDAGDRTSPPLSLCLMAERALASGAAPRCIVVHPTAPDSAPDATAWEAKLGVQLQVGSPWSWRNAPSGEGIALAQESRRWQGFAETLPKLRPAVGMAAIALALHGIALVADWTLLAGERRSLRGQMEARYRQTFPEAVAVVDPLLQMRRNLAEARHAAGQPDTGDFLPMVGRVAAEFKDVPPEAVRILSYEGGRMTLDLMGSEERAAARIAERLRQAGLLVDLASATGRSTLTVRAP